jgi:hypothetical protein
MNGESGARQDLKGALVENPKLQFILTGFSQVMGFRVFAFEGIAADWTRSAFTVRTDLALIRRYGIRLQELPLLCRGILDRREAGEEKRAFTYGEEDMIRYADSAAAQKEAARKGKVPRRPAADHAGASWVGRLR